MKHDLARHLAVAIDELQAALAMLDGKNETRAAYAAAKEEVKSRLSDLKRCFDEKHQDPNSDACRALWEAAERYHLALESCREKAKRLSEKENDEMEIRRLDDFLRYALAKLDISEIIKMKESAEADDKEQQTPESPQGGEKSGESQINKQSDEASE